MAKSKIDIIYDMVNLAYDVKRQWSIDKDSYWLGDYARAVIKAKDEKVYDKFVDLANQLETEGWDEFIDACKYLIDEYNQFEESKKSMKESINGGCYIYYDDDDGERNVFCDYVKGITDTRDWFYLNEYIIDAIHIFKNEKQAQKFIDEHLKYFADQDKVVIAEYPQTVSGFFESKKSLKESYLNYDVDDVYKELKRLCDKGKNVFSDFYVERNEDGFMVSISDDSSYIKLKDFIPYNIHYNENSFYMYYKNDSTYMTIFANYEDENAINVLVEVVRSLANLKGAYDKCETVSTEIVNQVSNLY